jgi:CheY-like chemotaxis protein
VDDILGAERPSSPVMSLFIPSPAMLQRASLSDVGCERPAVASPLSLTSRNVTGRPTPPTNDLALALVIASHQASDAPGVGEKAEEKSDVEDPAPVKPRALVVDDTPSNTKMLKVLLQRQGLVCDEAENGAVAVEMVRKSMRGCLLGTPDAAGYNIVFMDCNMPVMDGLAAARIIRTQLHFGAIVVGCTGNANEHEVEEFLEAGADFVMPKPMRYDQLQRLLEYAESVDFTSIPNTQLQLTDAPRLSTKASTKRKGKGTGEGSTGQQRLRAVPRARGGSV